MHEMSRESTRSADWDDSERSINNPEDFYFNTFNSHFISLWVCASFITAVLSRRRGEMTQNNTIITALCSDGNIKPWHVSTQPHMYTPVLLIHMCKCYINLCVVESMEKYTFCLTQRATTVIVVGPALSVCSVKWEHSVCSFIWIP